MKTFLLSIVFLFVLTPISNAYFVYGNIITCYPKNVNEDYTRQFKAEFKACKAELKQLQSALQSYKRQYDRCEKKRRYTNQCQVYYDKYQEYYQQLNP